MVIKDLGVVTAYGYAVEGGYQGTEAQFMELLANARGIVSIVLTGTSGLVKTYTILYTDGTTTTFNVTDGEDGEVTEAQLNNAIADFAENGIIANAKQLIPSAMETERVPYNFRTAGGSLGIGDREFDKLVGLSLPWNQLVQHGNFDAPSSGWDYNNGGNFTIENNKLTFTVNNGQGSTAVYRTIPSTIVGHKYLALVDMTQPRANSTQVVLGGVYLTKVATPNVKMTIGGIANATSVGTSLYIYINRSALLQDGDKVILENAIIIDLTQLFGSTIADYIYSLETATAGAGVAWFKKLFPKDYYAYNAGELISVKTSKHITTGFNQWDEEWEVGYITPGTGQPTDSFTDRIRTKNFIPILPNTTYYKKCPTTFWNIYYDADKNYLGYNNAVMNATFTTPVNAHFMKFATESNYGGSYKNDICINLHWDGARDGEYEPYKKNSYALDPIELRGILKLDSNNEPYADGDTYEADGTVTRRYKKVVFDGSNDESWQLHYYDDIKSFKLYLSDSKSANNTPVVATSFTFVNFAWVYTTSYYVGTSSKYVYFTYSGASTVEEWRTYLASHPITLVYELETPTTESADPFTDPQTVDNWGTEQYVDKAYTDGDRDVEIPCGHETKYPMNLRDKLETSPNAPTSDGDYIVHCESGQLTYIALGSTTTIQNIISRLEALED